MKVIVVQGELTEMLQDDFDRLLCECQEEKVGCRLFLLCFGGS
jgi:hypothetical protein